VNQLRNENRFERSDEPSLKKIENRDEQTRLDSPPLSPPYMKTRSLTEAAACRQRRVSSFIASPPAASLLYLPTRGLVTTPLLSHHTPAAVSKTVGTRNGSEVSNTGIHGPQKTQFRIGHAAEQLYLLSVRTVSSRQVRRGSSRDHGEESRPHRV